MRYLRAHAPSFVWVVIGCLLAGACSGATATPATAPTVAAATAAPTLAPTRAAPTEAPTTAPTTAPTAAPTTEATTAPSTGPQALTILDYSGYEQPDFWKAFAAQHPDVQPTYSFFADDAEAFSKVASGFPFDLVHPCVSWLNQYVDRGLIQPIDTSRLKNWSGVRPELAKLGQFNGKQYFIPWEWGFDSILVRTDKVKTVPQSWADLWNPEYKGHVSLNDSGEVSHATGALALGLDPFHTTPAQEAQIKAKLIAIKPNLLNFWTDSTEINQLIASGDVWVAANVWPDAYKAAVDAGLKVDYIEPKEGRLSWVCGYALSAKVQNGDLAYDYLDALIAPDAMAAVSNQYAYGASNAQALPLTDPALVTLFHLDDPSLLSKTVFYQPLTDQQRQDFTSMWTDVKASP